MITSSSKTSSLATITAFVLFATCGSPVVAQPAPSELVDQMFAGRGRLLNGQMSLVLTRQTFADGDPDGAASTAATYFIAFDGDTVRFDLTQPHGIPGQMDQAFVRRTILSKDQLVRHSNEISRGRPLAVRIDYGDRIERDKLLIFHPKVLGLWPSSLGQLHGLTFVAVSQAIGDHITGMKAANLLVTKVIIDEVECWRLDYDVVAEKKRISLTIAPALGHQLLACSIEGSHQDGAVKDSLSVDVKEYDGRVYFPSRLDYSRELNGKVIRRETVLVKGAVFNAGVAQDVFTLAGLELPAGLSVYEYPPHAGGGRKWDGKKLVLLHDRSVVQSAAPHSGKMKVFTAANLMVIGVGLLWYGRRAKTRKKAAA